VRYVFLKVLDGREVALGVVEDPGCLPELLRHVADYYDDNPTDCASLLAEPAGPRVLPLLDPFRAPSV
jgi:hypothetical protein